MESKRVQTWFFAAVFLLLLAAVARIFAPFFTILLWSTLLYIMFSPLYHRIIRGLDLSKRTARIVRYLAAGLFSIASVVVIVLPLSFVLIQLARQLSILIRAGRDFINANPDFFSGEIDSVSLFLSRLGIDTGDLPAFDLKERLAEALSVGVNTLVRFSTGMARNLGLLLISLVFMIFTLFFFYVDGDYLLKLVVRAVPIRNEYMKELVGKFRDITRNLVFGYILVAVAQALMALLIFSLFKIEGSLALAIILFFCSFIPMIGAGAVWGPLGVLRILGGDPVGGFIFLAICGVFISTLDNVLRPLFLKDRIKLHPLIIFFSILGGISIFGFNGLVLGPMIVIIFLTVLDIFLIEHGLPENK
ncbi:MAG: hypothetical protein A2Z99_12185 [Treponema sp. GWB1_62_6]|nr:MAG: hypothetical protein A2001_06535 [Treponema sp. GWC1_61_84]OHE64219.1 MAG: hypothetical protein A2Y36_08050 [Treponema sp. GWA1_62_8]OHE64379.1 MAG: hypothetical protein A2Z99_12185 [Treponema sp. GWB1_62_6]OHE76277.1 MAG: hypothetical protein A2413_02860 [Treponema sp. RIFOXYC1_FULL_61_9]HCM28819.1 AI-2E family transporter [Treponema sp.]